MDKTKCTVCGLCVKVCTGAPLFIENKIAVLAKKKSILTYYNTFLF
ncbi:hypothetical protein [Clostridium felsineum]